MRAAWPFRDPLFGLRLCCVYGGWQEQLLGEAGAGFRLPADPVDAAARLRELANDPSLLADAGRNARRLAETRFSRDELAAKVETVLLDSVAAANTENLSQAS